jgi:hypothetical protein
VSSGEDKQIAGHKLECLLPSRWDASSTRSTVKSITLADADAVNRAWSLSGADVERLWMAVRGGMSSPNQGGSSSPQSVTGCHPAGARHRRRHGRQARKALAMRGFGSLPSVSGGEPPSPPSSRFESSRVGVEAGLTSLAHFAEICRNSTDSVRPNSKIAELLFIISKKQKNQEKIRKNM